MTKRSNEKDYTAAAMLVAGIIVGLLALTAMGGSVPADDAFYNLAKWGLGVCAFGAGLVALRLR